MYRSTSDPEPGAASSAVANDAENGSNLSAPARGFIADLTHAMQAAAEHQREATNTEVEAMTAAHLERVRVRAAAEAEELRRMAQDDIDEIHAWQEAEAIRLREEAARRIVARGEELDSYLVRHAAIIDSEVEQIEGAVANYQLKLDDYFGQITAEPNPSEIARLADELPDPPDLGKVGGEARAQALAAVQAADEEAFSPTAPGPELVPVMAPTASSNGGNGANAANGTDSAAAEEHTNPAMRLLRSIATLAANPADAKPAGAVAVAEKPADAAAETGHAEVVADLEATQSR
jgi:hypothetical protein